MKIRAEFCFFHRKRVFLNRILKVDFNRVGSDHIAISRVAQAARRAPARDVHRQGAGRKHCFSELLKRDDGVLRGLLREAGVGELEAAGEIDRFVFEVRHAAQHGQEFRLDGFGVLRPGPNGTIAFAYEPRPVQSAADAAPGAASVPAGTRPAPAGQTPRNCLIPSRACRPRPR